GRGYSPELTAALMLPVPAANLLTSLLLGTRIAPSKRALLGIVCGVSGFSWLAFLPPDGAWFQTVPPAILIGCAAALCFTAFHYLVLSEVPTSQSGQASGLFNLARQLGTTLGTVILLSSIQFQLSWQIANAQKIHTIAAYSGTWGVAAVLALLVLPLLLFQKRSTASSS